jgi:hypothetical protein
MAQLADAAIVANKAGQTEVVNAKVMQFRKLYEENTSLINGQVAAVQGKPQNQTADSTATGGAFVETSALPKPSSLISTPARN